jgi:hypothetical protein
VAFGQVCQVLGKAGIQSVQIVSVQNAPEALVTITRVTMQSGATSARHRHPHSEQIWLVEHGTATLLLDAEQTAEIGDLGKPPRAIRNVSRKRAAFGGCKLRRDQLKEPKPVWVAAARFQILAEKQSDCLHSRSPRMLKPSSNLNFDVPTVVNG